MSLIVWLPVIPADDAEGPEILDLTGDVPSKLIVEEAVKEGMQYLLKNQRKDGSWEVTLEGEMLSETADEAVDAVAVTALCGLALRLNGDLDKTKVDVANRKAFEFIMKRILQGKLSRNVYYAVWRYNFGLRFLTAEYEGTQDEEYKDKIEVLAKRMVQALVDMQLMGGKPPRRVGGAIGKRTKLMRPARMGLQVALPTEDDYLNGARVTRVSKGSAAETAGIRKGDRIIRVENERIENGYDFTMLESQFMGGQTVRITHTRKVDGELQKSKAGVKLEATWPGSLGIVTITVNKKLIVDGFTQWSPAAKKGLKKGDKLISIHKTELHNELDYTNALDDVRMGRKIKVKYEREGKAKTMQVTCVPAPFGTIQLIPMTEDKSGESGVVVKEIKNEWTPLGRAELKEGDRILKINGYQILGLDHYLSMTETFPAGIPLIIHYKREKEIKTALVIPNMMVFGSRLEVTWLNDSTEPILAAVARDTVTYAAGFRKGDKIMTVRYKGKGYPVNSKSDVVGLLSKIPAGSEVKFSIQRKNDLKKITIDEMPKLTAAGSVKEVGGWNYYPMGSAASFVSASTLIALVESAKVIGSSIKAPNETLEAAADLLESMRTEDEKNGARGFMYSRDADDKDIRGQMGRIAVCELSLVVYGRKGNKNLETTLKKWLEHRHELDKVRNYTHTHNRSLYSNAAYYWMFGHYYSCKAVKRLGRGIRDEILGKTTKALIKRQHPKKGTWRGHPAFGELCGTAQALMIFGEIRDVK